MLKFFKKRKIFKALSMLLVAAFTMNVASGCSVEPNGVDGNLPGGGNENSHLGVGGNINGYLVYSKSTFDPMTKELFMGYLMNGRNFTLVVVPGDDEGNLKNEDNYLFSSAQAGIYQYDDIKGEFTNPEYKALLYYATNEQISSWFKEFEDDDNFINNALNFASSKTDLERGSRFKCEDLVNFGSGLNAEKFCDYLLYNNSITYVNDKNGTTYSLSPFSDSLTGGMVVFFGYYSIEGYMTYEHIRKYSGSTMANSFDDCTYSVGNVSSFDLVALAKEYKTILTHPANSGGYGYAGDTINKYINNPNRSGYDILKQDIVSAYTDSVMSGKKGCDRLKASYQLIEQSLLTDYGSNINSLKEEASRKVSSSDINDEEKDKYNFISSTIEMLENFKQYASRESLNIKFSVGLYNRYSDLINVSNTKVLITGKQYESIQNVSYDKALALVKGNENNKNDGDYLLMVTANGFIFDRGDSENRQVMGASDMLGFSDALEQLILMDSCPNATVAAEMFNMLSNLSIYVGLSLAITGGVVLAGAVIGLTIASVIGKLAAFTAVTPVPGARIAALVLAAIAGLIAIGVGLFTLFKGLQAKADLKGMGASETNYCSTYKATITKLLKSIKLNIPIYHYEIPKDSSKDISVDYCLKGTFNEQLDKCVYTNSQNKEEYSKSISIPLYYYADREKSEKLNLSGMPILMYFSNHELVDYISGATTPEYIVEILRLWGLLSAREIVYQGNLVDKKVQIYHTSNTNSRTHTINEAKYCFTMGFDGYEKDLYTIDSNEFCYYNSSSHGPVAKSINKSSYSIDKPVLTVDIGNSINGLEDAIEAKLKVGSIVSDLKNQTSYKVADYVNSNFELKNEVSNFKLLDFNLNDSENGEINISYVDEDENKSMKGYLLKSSNNAFFISLNAIKNIESIYLIEEDSENNGYKITLIANIKKLRYITYKKFIEKIEKILESDDATIKNLDVTHVLEYMAGNYKFPVDDSLVEERPIYFTASIKETPQKKCGKEEEDTYLYNRTGNFLGIGNGPKCLLDKDVRNGDSPIESDFQNVYSTSVQVGTVTISINELGNIVFDIKWSFMDQGGN